MKTQRTFCACFVALAFARLALAATDSWDGNLALVPSGDFGTAINWNPNTVPGVFDTAEFNLPGPPNYTVRFPGTGAGGTVARTYDTDRLLVRTNTVSFQEVSAASTYQVGNTTTAEVGRGIIIGQLTGDGTVLDDSLASLKCVAATIGDAATVKGTLNVTAGTFEITGSSMTDDELIVGNHGDGALRVTGGASVSLTGSLYPDAVVGNYSGSNGSVTVSGAGSTWIAGSTMYVGKSGTGALSITGGGAATSGLGAIGYDAGSTGMVTVDGAGSTWTNTHGLEVGVGGSGTLIVSDGGTVSVSPPELFDIGSLGTVNGNGNIVAEVDNHGVVSPGTSAGAMHVPGALHITHAYTQFAAGKLQIELGGIVAGTDYDQLLVNGPVTLDGTLQVLLVNSFVPAAGDYFALIGQASLLTGAFSTVQLPLLGLMWNASQLYTNGLLRVTIVGDYNHNGIVDAADYTVWRDTLGQTGTGLAADGNGNGMIDAGDYTVWKTNFGNHAGSGSGASAAVPEPASLLLLLPGTLALCSRRRPKAS